MIKDNQNNSAQLLRCLWVPSKGSF